MRAHKAMSDGFSAPSSIFRQTPHKATDKEIALEEHKHPIPSGFPPLMFIGFSTGLCVHKQKEMKPAPPQYPMVLDVIK